VFAEMRSNILLLSGQHYKKVARGLTRNLRNAGTDRSKRLRLVKNHTAKVISDIKDILASMTPGVIPYPQNEHEASHTKAAELAKVVWEDGKSKNGFEDLVEELRNCFVSTGEVASKIFYDPSGGGLLAYEQATSPDGAPLYKGPDGQPTPEPGQVDPLTGEMISQHELLPDETRPIFKPKITISKIEPYNLLRPKNAKSIKSAKYLIERKMVDLEDAKALIKNAKNLSPEQKEERLQWIEESGATTYKIFDGTTGSFQDSDGQIMFKEFYFRQCPEWPKGQYFIKCDKGILFQGDLPFGECGEEAFPIRWGAYEHYEGSSRGFSTIKKLRPCQAEINRCASSISETQIVLGSDKVMLTKGAKFTQGVSQPGMRVYHTTDTQAQVIPGRSGDQYTGYLEYNVEEIYRLGNVPENANPISQNFDPRAELFKKQSQKARFTEPAARFSRFLRANCESYLFFAQKYANELDLKAIVGSSLAVDVAEFQNVEKICYKVKLLEVGDDLDSAMAKTLELDTILQYAGKDIDPDTLKVILSQYPVVNKTQAFKHLNMDLKNIESDMLALDRGEYRPASKYDEHPVFIKHLTSRKRERGFALLGPQIAELYDMRIQEHEKFIAQLAEEQKQAQSQFIPSGGAVVKAELYINPDPNNPEKARKATFPTEALMWLTKQLEAQGSTQEMLEMTANQGAMAEIANMIQPTEPLMDPSQQQMPNFGGQF
jgi:hypothetical protein